MCLPIPQRRQRRGVTHRFGRAEEVPAQGLVDIVGESLPQAVGPGHAHDTGSQERWVKNFPGRLPTQATATVLLAREQIALRVRRQSSRLDPAGDCFCRIRVEHDGGPGMLSFRILAGDVESRQGRFSIPDLTDFESEQFTDPQAGADAEDDERVVAEGISSPQVCQS